MNKKKKIVILIALFSISSVIFVTQKIYSDTLPFSNHTIDASAVQGSHSWYTSAIPVTITSTQGTNPIKNTSYYIGTNAPSISTTNPTTTTLVQQGENTLYYFATDTLNASEPAKSFPYKLDLVAPTGWTAFTVVQSGNSHTFTISVKISDKTSGIDPSTAEFQYSTDEGQTWGYYSTLTQCNSTWNSNLWKPVSVSPNVDSSPTVTVSIPTTDYCNSNWAETKYIRIRVRDMAGLLATKQFALMSPTISTTNGDVYGANGIDMTTELGSTATGIVYSGTNTVNNLSSVNGWQVKNYLIQNTNWYTTLLDKITAAPQNLPASLPTTSGVYKADGKSISGSDIPNSLATAKNLGLVIFINGDLFIDSNITLDKTSSIVWVVNGDIGIKSSVTRADGIYITNQDFNSLYNGNSNDGGSSSSQLNITGQIIANGSILFGRSLNGTQNLTTPAEVITGNAAILLNPFVLTYLKQESNITWNEVIDY